jgi:O-antigen/teichoic acid export membrane protein
MSGEAPGLGGRMAKGVAWMVGLRFVVRSIGILSTIILARLLMPQDFGLVALASLLYGLLEVMGDFSFDQALIRDQEAGRSHYDTVWTLTILRGVVIAILIVVGTHPAAAFFEEPRLVAIMYCLAAAAFVDGFRNVGVVDFRKELRFDKEFRFMLARRVASFVLTVVLAVIWRNYWALVAGLMAGRFVLVPVSYFMHPYRPRLSFARWRGIMDFSKWLLLNNILHFVNLRSDIFFLGKLVGTESLGFYRVAHDISNLPTSQLSSPIRRATFPGYAKMAGDWGRLQNAFLDVFSLMLLASAPLAVGIGLVADPMVKVFLGHKWVDSIPLVQVLAIYGLLSISTANSAAMFVALGRPYILTAVRAVSVAALIPLLLWSVEQAGALGAAYAVTGIASLTLGLIIFAVLRLLKLPLARLFAATWRTVGATATMAAAVYSLQVALDLPEGVSWLALELAALVLTGMITYVGMHLGLWRLSGFPDGAERHAVSGLLGGLARLNAGRLGSKS